MKRYIRSARKARVPEKQNVYDILEAMGWNDPTFCDIRKFGYKLKWGGYSLVEHAAKDLGEDRVNAEFQDRLPYTADGQIDWLGMDRDLSKEYFRRLHELTSEAREEARQLVEQDIQEIYDRTGIQCKLSSNGDLIVPFAEVEGG